MGWVQVQVQVQESRSFRWWFRWYRFVDRVAYWPGRLAMVVRRWRGTHAGWCCSCVGLPCCCHSAVDTVEADSQHANAGRAP
jgi:hypothetical protein